MNPATREQIYDRHRSAVEAGMAVLLHPERAPEVGHEYLEILAAFLESCAGGSAIYWRTMRRLLGLPTPVRMKRASRACLGLARALRGRNTQQVAARLRSFRDSQIGPNLNRVKAAFAQGDCYITDQI